VLERGNRAHDGLHDPPACLTLSTALPRTLQTYTVSNQQWAKTMTVFLYNGPEDARVTCLLAHGAGAPMDSDFMNTMADLLGERYCRVARFEFPYMALRRTEGGRRPPPRAERLTETYREAVADLGNPEKLLIGGKSFGGRVASMIADELHATGQVAGLVCLGYPFHPPGKPDKLRTGHLRELTCPTFICQGTRDPFGGSEEVTAYDLSPAIRFHWAEDGDHDLAPRRSSGHTKAGNWRAAADAIQDFAMQR